VSSGGWGAEERQKTKHTRDDGKGKERRRIRATVSIDIKNYLNLQYNINNALSHNCYECFPLPNAIGGTNTKLLA